MRLLRGRPAEGIYSTGVKWFEKGVTFVLTVLMAVVVLLATVELGWIIVRDIVMWPAEATRITELLDIFGLFLLVLIGIELLETIRAYAATHVLRAEVVMTVGIIAIARKVIILDVNKLSALTLLGIASIIIALAAGYFLVRRQRREDDRVG
jgi:uncharacterized membrane protein (DUF373 family)